MILKSILEKRLAKLTPWSSILEKLQSLS